MDIKAKKPMNDRVLRGMKTAKKIIEERARVADRKLAEGDEKGARLAVAEKEAAERKLARWNAEYDVTGTPPGRVSGPRGLWNHGAWEGEKCTREMRYKPVKDIAAIIREDIKMARKIGQKTRPQDGDVAVKDPIGDAPQGIKFRTRTRDHIAIEVIMENIPREWGFQKVVDPMGYENDIPTPALRALLSALEEIHAAYNYDNSDTMTDYFERNYGGGVYVTRESGAMSRFLSSESAYYQYSKPSGAPVD